MAKLDFGLVDIYVSLNGLGQAWKEGRDLEKEDEFWEMALSQREKSYAQSILNFLDLALGYYCLHKLEMIPQLSFLFRSQHARERATFAHLVGYAGKNGLSVSTEIFHLASDPEPHVRRRAIQCLLRLRDHGLQGTEDTIETAKTDPDEKVREMANGTSF